MIICIKHGDLVCLVGYKDGEIAPFFMYSGAAEATDKWGMEKGVNKVYKYMLRNICVSTPLSFLMWDRQRRRAGEETQGASYPEHQSPCPQCTGPH